MQLLQASGPVMDSRAAHVPRRATAEPLRLPVSIRIASATTTSAAYPGLAPPAWQTLSPQALRQVQMRRAGQAQLRPVHQPSALRSCRL